MKKVKRVRILVIAIAAVFLIQAGYAAYSMLGSSLYNKQVAEVESTDDADNSTQVETDTNSIVETVEADNQLEDGTSTEISQEILDLIKLSDPDNYTKNIDNYKQLLTDLNVHVIFKDEIERLIKNGKKLPDILTAYAFLNDSYGKMEDLEKLVNKKASGEKWTDVFMEYDKSNPEFVPSSFDSQYLNKLLKTPEITEDDVMTADRVSKKVGASMEEVINKRIAGLNWRLINAQYKIVNGQEELLQVSVTREELAKYVSQSKLSEDKVVETLVIADKLGISPDDALKSVEQGLSKEDIYAEAYGEKYY